MAKLYFKYGVMGSAKSMNLMTTAYNFMERGLGVVCFKPAKDTRDAQIKSRVGISIESELISDDDNVYDITKDIIEYRKEKIDWILVDECQFLKTEQIDQLALLVDEYGINIMCYGLRTDFRMCLFEGPKRLFEIADTIEEMKSTCSCGKRAIVNARLVDGVICTEGSQIEIGGNEKYTPMCRSCWNKNKNNI